MTEQDIRQAYITMRQIDNTIPDEVLDFMRDASIEKLNTVERSKQLVSFLRQYQKACEIMHVNKIDAKNFVEQYKTNELPK